MGDRAKKIHVYEGTLLSGPEMYQSFLETKVYIHHLKTV